MVGDASGALVQFGCYQQASDSKSRLITDLLLVIVYAHLCLIKLKELHVFIGLSHPVYTCSGTYSLYRKSSAKGRAT